MTLIVKSNIKKVVRELQKNLDDKDSITSVAEEVGTALERKVEDLLEEAIKRAKANARRTLQARDL